MAKWLISINKACPYVPVNIISMADEGQKIYNVCCISCHQADGKGDGSRYPSLVASDWVSGDKDRLISVMLNGLEGPIEVNGMPFNDMMPKQDFLSDDQIANVLSYIRMNINNNAGAIRAIEVTRVRDGLKDKYEEIEESI